MSTSPFGGMAGRYILPCLLACMPHLLNEREFREEISWWWWPQQGGGSGEGASRVGLLTAMAGWIPFEKVIHLLLLAFLMAPPFLLLTRLRTQIFLSPSSSSVSQLFPFGLETIYASCLSLFIHIYGEFAAI